MFTGKKREASMSSRPRVGFIPTRPQQDAGIRIDPPPSLACAIGTTPDATSAPAPPDDPPVEWLRFHGLRVGPNASGSVVPVIPSSGVALLPIGITPSRSNAITVGSLRFE